MDFRFILHAARFNALRIAGREGPSAPGKETGRTWSEHRRVFRGETATQINRDPADEWWNLAGQRVFRRRGSIRPKTRFKIRGKVFSGISAKNPVPLIAEIFAFSTNPFPFIRIKGFLIASCIWEFSRRIETGLQKKKKKCILRENLNCEKKFFFHPKCNFLWLSPAKGGKFSSASFGRHFPRTWN